LAIAPENGAIATHDPEVVLLEVSHNTPN